MGRSIIPTAEADMLYPRAVSILEDLRQLMHDISAVSQSVSGHIKFAASTIPGNYILPQAAAQFKIAYPETSFEIHIYDSKEVSNQIVQGEYLLGMSGASNQNEKLHYYPFYRDKLVLAIPATATSAISSTDTLKKIPLILR